MCQRKDAKDEEVESQKKIYIFFREDLGRQREQWISLFLNTSRDRD